MNFKFVSWWPTGEDSAAVVVRDPDGSCRTIRGCHMRVTDGHATVTLPADLQSVLLTVTAREDER